MNLREIDRLVATKVMGWQIFTSKNVDTGTVSEFYDDGENLIKVSEWSPTLDIQDAWQVVEKFESVDLIKREHGYICWIHDNGGSECNNIPQETAPLAICLAALKAYGIEVEAK